MIAPAAAVGGHHRIILEGHRRAGSQHGLVLPAMAQTGGDS